MKKKELVSTSKRNGLSVNVKEGLKRAGYLDISFDLTQKTYQPHKKPNSSPLYINKNANIPSSIIKQLLPNRFQTFRQIKKNLI